VPGPHAAGLGVEPEQLGVVVEHLLEVRDEPLAVDAVAGEAAAQVIVDAAAVHAERVCVSASPAGPATSRRRSGVQQDGERGGVRELGLAPKPPHSRSTLRQQLRRGDSVEGVGVAEVVRTSLAAVLVGEAAEVGHALAKLSACSVSLPRRCSTGRTARAGPGGTRAGRSWHRGEVGAAVERALVGRQEHGERPAAALAHELDDLLVDRVDVGALLAVDLDVDEAFVHQRRDLGGPRTTRGPSRGTSGTRRSRPRAGSAVLGAGAGERLRAPQVPVDRVVGVLAEVRAGRLARRFMRILEDRPKHGLF
jgi:hypothetical protein